MTLKRKLSSMPFPISAQSASSPSLLPSRKRRRGLRFACAVMVAGTLALSACTDGNKGANENAASSAQGKQKSHFLAVDAPTVINAPDPLGLVAAEKFFSSKQERKAEMTELVVLSGDSASLPAAQYAIAAGVPVMSLPADATVVSPTADGSDQGWLAEVKRFVEERGIEKLSTFNLTAEQKETLAGIDGVDEVAEPGEGSEAQTVVDEPASLAVLEDIAAIESPRDGEDGAPVILVAAGTSAAQVATARAAGLSVEVLPAADPRATSESMTAVANNNVVAVGSGFGNQELFDRQVQLASNGELPGGGGLVFPGRRMVALYGHPSGPALGVMGEQGPAEAVAVAKDWAAQYQELTQWPVIPAFEVIATVASSGPGDDGDYSNETDPAELKPYVDAIVNAGGYAVLDLQPGRARLLDQAKIYEDL
ncbi:MAG: cell wall-binding repeat-containing protein, partial [Corynebacterium sp.]|nr:cell wall-binding repeat-containing protein [Corynebacterium sp.]